MMIMMVVVMMIIIIIKKAAAETRRRLISWYNLFPPHQVGGGVGSSSLPAISSELLNVPKGSFYYTALTPCFSSSASVPTSRSVG